MSSKLQLDVRYLNRWWRHVVNAYEVRQAWCLLQVKLCDPCLSALKWFVYHARRYTIARLLLYFTFTKLPSPEMQRAALDRLTPGVFHSTGNNSLICISCAALQRGPYHRHCTVNQ